VHFAETGRRLFGATDLPLRFHESPAEVTSSANAVLASGVLQYLPDPYAALDELSRLDPRVIVIDRTPFARRSDGHVFVQRVTKPLAPASYPLASLSRQRVAETLADRYDLLQSFPSPDSPIDIRGAEADYGGEIWVRRG
jgi:putative methyltransferase (TIGR04325 family)